MTLRRLRWLFAAQGVSLGILLPFLVPLLHDRGLGAAQIGFVLGASGLVSLLAYPVWGTVADSGVGRRRTLGLTGVTAAIGGLWIVMAGSDPVALTMALSVALVGALAWGPLSDAVALGTLGKESSDYGRLRAFTSLGWAGSAVAAGLVWSRIGSDPVFVAFAVFAMGVSAIVLSGGRRARTPETLVASGPPSTGSRTDAQAAVPGLRSWLPLLATPVLFGFMIGLLVASIGQHASWRFISLRILEQGGGVFLVGLAAALPALVEIPVFSRSRQLTDRLGLRMIYVLGSLLAAGLLVLIAFASQAWVVTLLRTIDGSSYALRYLGMVLVIGALLPRHLHAVGQSMGWFVAFGVAPIIADAAGGTIYDYFGGTVLFLCSAALLVVGGGIVYLALSGPVFRRWRPVDADEPMRVPPTPP